MNWNSWLAILIVAGYIGFEINAVRRSQHLFEPLFSFDQFVSMHHAVEACGGADDDQRRRFADNLAAVIVHARRDLSASRPDASASEIERMVAERDAERAQEIAALVRTEGCDGPAIRKWQTLHQQRARLRIRAREGA